jgi:hypothetical protein
MSRKPFVIAIMICAGCAVAPVGFYESAFPAEKRICLSGGLDLGRSYDMIPWDTTEARPADADQVVYFSPVALLGLDYSPVPYLTLGGELLALPGGAGLKAKAVPLSGDNAAAAVLLRAGAARAEESDSWGGTTTYDTQYLVGAGILSFGNPALSVGVGPKLVYSHVNIKRSSSGGDFRGNVMDYGGFLNGVLNYKFIGLSAELSLLSIDRPKAGARSLKPYYGGALRVRF